jgi:Immunity protein 74
LEEADVTAHEEEFSYPRPNVIISRRGFTVEVQTPTGIRYTESDKHMRVYAEMLASAEPAMAVRRTDVTAWDSPNDSAKVSEADRDRILANIGRAFEFRGWGLEVD